MSVQDRHALNTLASSSQLANDAKKIIEGYRKVSTDWRVILRADYLMMLKTLICIKKEYVLVKLKNNEFWIGRLCAIDPNHVNLILLNAENLISKITANKVFIRGDQVELILQFQNRELAIKAFNKIRKGNRLEL